ncbi:PKD domain-containing protein [Halostagnicola bangensis]
MNNSRTLVAALVVLSAVAVGATFAVTAQDGSPPGEPANFYGSVVDEDGIEADPGTILVTVVDGEVAGEISVETAGEYGGDGPFDEKLSLDSAAGEEVSFRVGDASGPEAVESPVDLEPGTVERPLEFPAGAFEYEPTELESITVELAEAALEPGETTEATVTATFDDGTTETVTDEAVLSSADSEVASVDGTTIKGEANGDVSIVAEYSDGTTESDKIDLTVEDDADSGSGSGPGSGPGTDPEPDPKPEPDPTTYSLELLGEQNVNHAHACTHGDYDERTPLEAGDTADTGPIVDDDHVIWEVTYEGEDGYVTFDAEAHWYDGPFVFYTAFGSVEPVDAEVLERGGVDDEEHCDTLDEYIEVETPDDGTIDLELTGGEPVDGDTGPGTEPGAGSQLEATFDVEPSNPVVGETVTLDARNTTGDDIDAYNWTVGDAEASGERTNVTLESAGETKIELTVENADGETDTSTETVNVSAAADPLEVTQIEVPEEATAGDSLEATVTVENTADANATGEITYEFDGSVRDEESLNLTGGASETLSFTVTAPDDPGTYRHAVETGANSRNAATTVEPDRAEGESDESERDDETRGDDPDESDLQGDDDSGDDDTADDGIPGFTAPAAIAAFAVLLSMNRLRRSN